MHLAMRGGAVRSARQAHNLEVAGSNPAPATSLGQALNAQQGDEQDSTWDAERNLAARVNQWQTR